MVVKGGPKIVSDGLVFNLDAAGAVSDKGYPINGLPVEYLIVAGGGAGGRHHGGGGGAGGLLHGYTRASLSAGSYTVVVGAGGARDSGTNGSPNVVSGSGQNSSAFGLTSIGGGGGGQYNTDGANGGSGGGPTNWSTSKLGGTGTSGQGYSAVNGSGAYNTRGGGGGSGGSPTSTNNYNNGGIGRYFGYSFGRSLGEDGWFAGGGAAGTYGGPCSGNIYARFTGANVGGKGGGGVGGYGCHGNSVQAQDGQANTGGGGGGQPAQNRLAGNGGSGVVIIKYKGPQKATGGDSIITRQGFTIHVFTSSGTFTVGDRVGGLSTSKIVGTLENMDSTNYSSGNKGYFSLSTDEYIDCSDYVNDLIFNAPATVSCWLMPLHDKNTGSTFFFIANDVDPVSSAGGYAFLFRYGSTTGGLTGETFVVYRYDNGGAGNQVTLYGISNGYEYQNQWVNAVCVIENNTWKVYVNGVLQTLTRGTNWTGSVFKFGDNISPKDKAWVCTPGANINIASFKVYNIGLSADQILDNYNATKGRFGL